MRDNLRLFNLDPEEKYPSDDPQASAKEKSTRQNIQVPFTCVGAKTLAAAHVVIFAQMVDDPSEHPEKFPGDEYRSRRGSASSGY